jgi:hypothetical protein
MNDIEKAKHFKLYKKATNALIWQTKGSEQKSPFFYTAGLIVDFDGAPDAYAVPGHGKVGKDDLISACPVSDKAGHPPTSPSWKPTYKSTVRDPCTGASIVQATGRTSGYYISESSLKDIFHAPFPGNIPTDPRYQTDASTFPYVALPDKFLKDSGLIVGDYAMAINGMTGAYSFAVYGDAKIKHVMGESSSALANKLGIPSHKRGGASRGVVYIVFPGTGLGPKMRCELSALSDRGSSWLDLYNARIDLVACITSCFSPEMPGVSLAFRTLGYAV